MIKGTTSLIKQMNKSTILSIIIKEGGISRAQLAKRTEISKSTVSFIVDELLKENLISETGEGISTKKGGRKPIELEFNATAGYIVGLNIGIKTSFCILSDLLGEVVQEKEFETFSNKEGDALANIIQRVHSLIENSGKKDKIIGMGIGIPGIADIENGVVLFAPKLNWINYNIQKRFEEEFEMNVFIDNDVNMAVLGEKWKGSGNNYNDFVFVSISAGIGGGIVINNKIHRGSSYTAGEIGYMVLSKDAFKHGKYTFDQFGYFESVASSTAVEEITHLSCEEAFEKAMQGDVVCLQVMDEMIDYLSLGMANIISILNPEALIIGGDISIAKEWTVNQIKEKVHLLTPVKCAMNLSDLGKRAGIIGCAASVLMNTYGVEFY